MPSDRPARPALQVAIGAGRRGGAGDQATLVAALRNPACYPHPAGQVAVIETHISYVLLSGAFAYKIKKAVRLGFLDFSTLAGRRMYCGEEFRLNRRLAPDLYLAVVAITGSPDAPCIAGSGEAIEYAVQMTRFAQDDLLDRQLAAGRLSPEVIDQLAEQLAGFHERAERAPPDGQFGSPQAVWQPMAQNFAQLGEQLSGAASRTRLADLEAWSRQRFSEVADLIASRLRDGWIRECHGDLHLGNIVETGAGLRIFDCIEFDAGLRWIDVLNEIAFLTMDLAERGRADYGHRLLNRYLEALGDYRGLPLLAFYIVYRALVRAKVAAIRAGQEDPASRLAELASCEQYLDCAEKATVPGKPRLLLMHGLAGSGKSWLAQQLLERLGALRIRSDIERKRLFGLSARTRSDSAVGDGIYDAAATKATYDRLAELASQILAAGYPVVVDAASLKAWQRDAFRELAAARGIPFAIVACTAPEAVLHARLATRRAAGRDASEADQAVLALQMRDREAITTDEEACTLTIDTSGPFPEQLLAALQDLPVPCPPASSRWKPENARPSFPPAAGTRQCAADRADSCASGALMEWQTFPHEADVGVRGSGSTLAEAFAGAATAMTSAICDPDRIADRDAVTVECAAPDVELLLVDWLNALIYEMATRRMLFSRFDVAIENHHLTATAWGEPVDISRHQPAAEVKGASFCELVVGRQADGHWLAQCVVDV